MQLSFPYPETDHAQVAGVDEVGRGPLAGEVVAAAVILDPQRPVPGLRDSKKLSAAQRERLYERIVEQALCYALGRATAQEIDELNILQASLLAMSRAVAGLAVQPGFVYVDGLHCPRWDYASTAVVKGDARVDCIAAASIIAKVTRDREMEALESVYPGYGFSQHKGYPTAVHLAALRRLGPCAIHRRSYRPVQLAMAEGTQDIMEDHG